MKAENFIKLIEQNRFDKISRNGMTLIAKRFRELEKQQLPINGVVKSFTAKDDRNYQNWLIDECVKTSEGNYIYKLAEYTEEEIWQKWYYNNL